MGINAKAMENYFAAMAAGKLDKKRDMTIINQKGRGFKMQRSKNIYKVGQWGGQRTTPITVSPVEQEIQQAKSNIKEKKEVVQNIVGRKRKRATSQNSSRKPKRRRKHSKYKKRVSKKRKRKGRKKRKRKGRKRRRKKGKKRGRKRKTKFQDVLS